MTPTSLSGALNALLVAQTTIIFSNIELQLRNCFLGYFHLQELPRNSKVNRKYRKETKEGREGVLRSFTLGGRSLVGGVERIGEFDGALREHEMKQPRTHILQQVRRSLFMVSSIIESRLI
jgi:hypothetical protein